MANRFVFPNVQRFDENGNPGSGWKLAFYKPGTSTPKDTYSDAALTTPNTNPVEANADGVWPDIFMDGEYDVRLLDEDDVQQESWDNVKGPIFAAVGGGNADDVPTNAYIGSFVPEILTSGTDTYTATFGRTIGTGETAVGDVQSANTTTTPTLNGDTVTTKDGSALWADALSGVHTFQKAASSWLVLDPNPVIPDSTDLLDEDDMSSDSETAIPTQQSVKAYVDAGDPTLQTVVDATNGGANDLSAVDFTGIKVGAKRITILFQGVSLSGPDKVLVQIGDSGGLETSGYTAGSGRVIGGGTSATAAETSAFNMLTNSAAQSLRGAMVLNLIDGTTWVSHHIADVASGGDLVTGGGAKALSSELDRVRITVSGTETFDGGSVNLLVE